MDTAPAFGGSGRGGIGEGTRSLVAIARSEKKKEKMLKIELLWLSYITAECLSKTMQNTIEIFYDSTPYRRNTL